MKRNIMTSDETPWLIILIVFVIGCLGIYFQVLGVDMPSTIFIMFLIGIPLYVLGKHLPIWNKYIGGGIVATLIGTSVLVHYQLIPQIYVEAIDWFTNDVNFLNLFVIVLITGSILSLDRKVLMQSFMGYIPAIIGGLIGAALLGILFGYLVGIEPSRVLTHYVLPIMGGGNGGGAVPLSEIYADVTGADKNMYYSFAIIILTIANVFAIIAASLLNVIGKKKVAWTGDKQTLLRNDKSAQRGIEESITPSLMDVTYGLVFGLSAYGFGLMMSKNILPKILGIKIHAFAYMIAFVVIIASLGIVPQGIKAGARRLQLFFSKYFVIIVMVGVGIDLDLNELFSTLTLSNTIVTIAIVLGALCGSAFVGYFVGFYPIDSAVTAGLCMANRGGSGDLAVLGASDRMDLMAYAQLSSRLGGAIVLVIGSLLFSLLK